MEQVSGRDGRTVLFVSHQMAMISNLCSRCILMEQGRVKLIGPTDEVVQQYLAEGMQSGLTNLAERTDRKGSGKVRFTDAWIEDKHGHRLSCAASGQDIKLCLAYDLLPGGSVKDIQVAIGIYSSTGVCVTELCNAYSDSAFASLGGRSGVVECRLPRLGLNRGRYTYNIIAEGGHEVFDYVTDAGVLDIEAGDFFGTGKIASDDRRLVLFDQHWAVRQTPRFD
jgi:lipopolysaccharide transport system ATP-binding protein